MYLEKPEGTQVIIGSAYVFALIYKSISEFYNVWGGEGKEGGWDGIEGRHGLAPLWNPKYATD